MRGRPLRSTSDADFDRFWSCYPRRVAKGHAERAWAALKPTPDTVEAMLAALAWQARQRDWLKNGLRYVPHPATWLRARRWEDEPPVGLVNDRGVDLDAEWVCDHEPHCGTRWACQRKRDIDAVKRGIYPQSANVP